MSVSVSHYLNPYVTNGLSNQFDDCTFFLRGIGTVFLLFLFHFSITNHVSRQNSSDVGLFSLPLSHKTDARLIWFNM